MALTIRISTVDDVIAAFAKNDIMISHMVGNLVAHRFSVRDWAPGWAVGVVEKQSTEKRTRGSWEVNYGKEFSPPVYIHELNPSEYSTNWVVVTQEE